MNIYTIICDLLVSFAPTLGFLIIMSFVFDYIRKSYMPY